MTTAERVAQAVLRAWFGDPVGFKDMQSGANRAATLAAELNLIRIGGHKMYLAWFDAWITVWEMIGFMSFNRFFWQGRITDYRTWHYKWIETWRLIGITYEDERSNESLRA